MAKKSDPKPVLGYVQCPDCGERGSVHKAAGNRSAYLYKRCGCGCDQRNGPAVQSFLWYETEWLPDLRPDSPPNICTEQNYEALRDSRVMPQVNSDAAPNADNNPESESGAEPGTEADETGGAGSGDEPAGVGRVPDESAGSGKVKRLGLAALLGAVAVAILRSAAR